jgi:chaperone required for assembly of F1-ATPase
MKRFWQNAAAAPHDGTWRIVLDGKPMHLPGGLPLRLDSEPLARALAAEWQNAGMHVGGTWSMDDLPLTQLAATALHRIAPDPAATVAALAKYAASDCLCYRAEHPEALMVRQHHAWQPWLDWAAATYDARLHVSHGIMPIRQPEEALAALAAALARRTIWELAGLGILVPAYGSLILGLAVADGQLTAAAAHKVAALDELFQESKWGEDADATARRVTMARDVAEAEEFIRRSVLF